MREDLHRRDCTLQTIVFICAVLLSLAENVRSFIFNKAPVLTFFPAQATKDSEFGFSMVYYENEEQHEKLFLIGAPGNDNSTGAVYSCPINALGNLPDGRVPCSSLLIKDHYVNMTVDGNCEPDANHQRLGAALSVSGKEIMVCAPNWSNTCTKIKGGKYNTLVGTCYASSDVLGPFTNFTPVYYYHNMLSPPRYYMEDGFCQAGFSISFIQQEKGELVIGAPGCTNWIGDVFWANVGDADSLRRQGNSYVQNQVVHGSDGSASVSVLERYMGYTVAEGVFAQRQMVVSSAPRENVLSKGEAASDAATYILESVAGDSSLKIWATLFTGSTDKWSFAYCGFSLAVADFDLDGMDDVAVGCPFYGSDEGAFVIFYQRKDKGTYKMEREGVALSGPTSQGTKKPGKDEFRFGKQKNERFASAIARIGDIDGDGFPEFAVGAPGASGGRGKVYIFCGMKGGLDMTPCQVLEGAEGQRSLGWALASGSGHLAVSMSRPTEVAMYSPLRVMLVQPELNCDTPMPVVDLTPVPVQVCVTYTFRDGLKDTSSRKFLVSLELDVGKEQSRLKFSDSSNRTRSFYIVATLNKTACESFDILKIKEDNTITSYELKANVSYDPEQHTDAAVDSRLPQEKQSTLRSDLRCDNNVECVTEVVVTVQRNAASYVYKPTEKLYVNVSVAVTKDPAYVPKLIVDTAGMLSYSAVAGPRNFVCEGATVFTCNIDIIEDAQIDLTFTLLPSQELKSSATEYSPELKITANFTSFSAFTPNSRPTASLTIPVELDVVFTIDGNVEEGSIMRGGSQKKNFTFDLKNANSYDYYVDFTVVQANESANCVSSVKLEENNTFCSQDQFKNSSTLVRCQYEPFNASSRHIVKLHAMVEGKDGCQTPLNGVASFSRLPFSLYEPDVVSTPLITLNEDAAKMWYENWWVWLLIALAVVVVVLNVVIVIVKKMEKKPRQGAGGTTDGDVHGGEAATQTKEKKNGAQDDADQPLDPNLNAP